MALLVGGNLLLMYRAKYLHAGSRGKVATAGLSDVIEVLGASAE